MGSFWSGFLKFDGDGDGFFFFFLDFGKGIMMGSDLGQDHHAQGGSGAFSRIWRVGGGVSVLCGRGWGAAEVERPV